LLTKTLRERQQIAKCQDEREGLEVACDPGINNNCFDSNGGYASCNLHGPYYQHGRTTQELAFEEWALMRIHHSDGMVDGNGSDTKTMWKMWPAHLELLRFLDSDSKAEQQPNVCHGSANKHRRAILSPFRLRSSNNKHLKDGIESVLDKCILFEGQALGGISLLSSYPRSGNTLLRTLLERVTSIVTGSDTRPDRTLSRSLALEHDLVGEGLVGTNNQTKSKASIDPRNYQSAFEPPVHVVKTHFPERKGWKPVRGSRVLLLVRNPYDAIDSYWNLCCTNTHTRTLDESVYEKYAKKFEGLARHEIQIWCEFHYYWIDKCEEEGVPLLVVRYEDLVMDTEAEMLRVMQFLIGQRGSAKSRELTSFWEWRIRRALGKPTVKSKEEKTTRGTKIGTGKNRFH